jgi:hypothetical protein
VHLHNHVRELGDDGLADVRLLEAEQFAEPNGAVDDRLFLVRPSQNLKQKN